MQSVYSNHLPVSPAHLLHRQDIYLPLSDPVKQSVLLVSTVNYLNRPAAPEENFLPLPCIHQPSCCFHYYLQPTRL